MKVIIVGRDSNCDFVVDDVKVSRKHLQIIINDNGEYSVVDLGSMNGTFVNGNRIKGEIKLHRGDVIKIGNTDLPWKDIADGQDSGPLPKKPRNWIVYVLAVLVVVLLSVIVGIIVNNHRNSKELEKNEEYRKLEELEEKADREYRDNLEINYKNALKGKKAADKKAETAEREKRVADSNAAKAEKDKAAAEKARKEAEEGKKAADKKAETAEREKQVADSNAAKAEKDKAAAKAAREKAENELQQYLNKSFNENFGKLNPNQYQEVAESLSLDLAKNKKPEDRIKEEFKNTSDNEYRKKIIKAIKDNLENAREKAEKAAVKTAREKAENAEKARKAVENEFQQYLNKSFYENFGKLNPNQYQEVVKSLSLDLAKNKKPEDRIQEEFKKAKDNEYRKKIIDVIKDVLQKEDTTSENNATAPDSTKSNLNKPAQ